MKYNEIKRDLEPGDIVVCHSNKYTIKEILFQDCYKDENAEYYTQYRDGSYIDIEFKDLNGGYHHWKSNLDGGTVIYKDLNEEVRCAKDFEKLYHNTGIGFGKVIEGLEKLGYNQSTILQGIKLVLKDVKWED